MIIALASPRPARSLDEGLEKIDRMLAEAASRGGEIACFPEAYLPGLRGVDLDVLPFDETDHDRVIQRVAHSARTHSIATILGMESPTPRGRLNVAVVIDAR